MVKTVSSLSGLISACKRKRVLLLTHDHADLDAVCSAAIFQKYLMRQRISSVVGVPSHINEQAQGFCFRERVSFTVNPDLCGFDVIILFDFNSPEQLGKLRKNFEQVRKGFCGCKISRAPKLFAFDHHVVEKDSLVKGENAFIDSVAVSTTELLLKLLDKFDNKQAHFWNCIGIIEDTGHFLVGDSNSFSSFAVSLKKSGKTYSDVLEFTKHHLEDGERIAFLKAAQRSEIQKIGSVVVVTSTVSFFQGAAATKLLGFGADIALVAGQEKEGCVTTLSTRADTEFKDENKFNLMTDLMIPLQKQVGGEVGGHSGAAQWKGKQSIESIMQSALWVLKNKFEKR